MLKKFVIQFIAPCKMHEKFKKMILNDNLYQHILHIFCEIA